MSGNPFFRASAPAAVPEEPVDIDPVLGDRVRMPGPQVPVQTIAPPAEPVLGRTPVGTLDPSVWVVGVHGGAGATSLAAVIPDAKECVRAWPMGGTSSHAPRVLLTARTHRSGLDAALIAAQEWASGDVPWLQLVGLVLIDDAPKLPTEVRAQINSLMQATPSGWHIGWQPAWRHLPLAERPLNRAARRTIHSISAEADKLRR